MARRLLLALAGLAAGLRLSRPAVGFSPFAAAFGRPGRRSAPRAALGAVPERAEEGLRAAIEYTARLDDGTVFAGTEGGEPLDFVVGEENSWLEEAVLGLAVGESRDVVLGEDRPVYGPWKEDLVFRAPLKELPEGARVGSEIQLRGGLEVRVTEIVDGEAVVDHNHPLAGKASTMSVTLVGLEELPASQRVVVATLSQGDGKTFPRRGDTLEVHYTGTLASDGTQFDSSRGGEPLRFPVGVRRVIRGWDIALTRMSVGERATLRIPAALGYGSEGSGKIPPDADLVFDVELLSVAP